MGEFKKLNFLIFGKKGPSCSPDALHWKKLGVPTFLKEYGPIDYIDFCPIEPYHFAVTSSVRIQVYNPVTKVVHKNFSKFQKNAYGGSFRSDGKLLCAGGEENLVKLFDVSSRSLLRVFEGHTAPVHRCFFTADNTHVASFSDDATVNLWDVPSEKKVLSFNEHNDYIRAGAVSPVSANLILSGGYDGLVKMFDKRTNKVLFSLSHGSPVESVLFLQSGGILLSAGGVEIKVWDTLSGGRLFARLCHHHKTVTALGLASGGTRIVSGSLDRRVNIYDVSSFQKVYSLACPNSILSVGVSANDETMVVGMVDGLVSVLRRSTEEGVARQRGRERRFRFGSDVKVASADVLVRERRGSRVTKHELHLKRFEHTKALRVVMAPIYTVKSPHVTVAVIQELMYRKAFCAAVGGYEKKLVERILGFLIKYIGDYRFTRVLVEAANMFMDVYEDSIAECGPEAVTLFVRLSKRLSEEVELTGSLAELEGCLSLLIAASRPPVAPASASALPALKPSQSARDFVVNVS